MTHVESVGDCGRDAALDFGCGFGRLTQALADHFHSVIGVDVATPMIDGANQHNQVGARCQYVHNDGEDLSTFEDESFDLVFTLAVLQHMAPRYSRRYLAEFFRVTKPGAIVAFQVPGYVKGQRLKEVLPDSVLSLGRRMRGHRGPTMQMYGF